jgi:hypothetical protein
MSQEPKRVLWQFQTHLNDIHEWNMERVSQEIQRIHTNCGCDYLEDLLTAVFIAHTKVLTAIRLGQSQKKVEINVPKVDHFLFKALCETAKLLWGSTYLFREGIPSVEKQQNYRAIEGMLNEGILQAVRTLVPVKSILKDFIHPETKGAQEDAEDSDEDTVEHELSSASVVPSASLISSPATPVASESSPESISESSVAPIEPLVPLEPLPANPILPLSNPDTPSASPTPVPVPSALLTASHPLDAPSPAPAHQVIVLDDKPSVRFGQFDAVFDADHPADSDMIYDPKESETDETPELDILDAQGIPLDDGDVDVLDGSAPASIGEEDYEELS